MTDFVLNEDGSVIVPPGRYFVGDPCMALSDEDWATLGASCNFFNDSPVGTVNGLQVVAFNTTGDAEYESDEGDFVEVNSGCIGLCPAATGADVPDGMFKAEFEDAAHCVLVGDIIWLGELRFNTDPSKRFDNEEDDEDTVVPSGP